MMSHWVGTVQMREESERGTGKWEEMWIKTRAEDGEGGRQWRAMEDCSTHERLQQEMLCRRQWTDEYVEHPESLMRQNIRDDSRVLTAVAESDWKRLAGRPHTSWLATMKNDLSYHSLSVEDATELALDRPLWRLLTASGAMHWIGASRTMMMATILYNMLSWSLL